MIPILYDKSATNFKNNGIGFLTEAIKCIVTEERNGVFELSLQYPITGNLYSRIEDGAIIKAKANDTSDLQLFRIYKSSKPINGIVTYSAEHVSYELNGIPCINLDVKNVTAQIAMTRAFDSASIMHNFTAISDITTPNSTSIKTPCSLRAILGGQRGSILDVWGGEFEFDNFTVKLHKSRGQNYGVTIEYGKNLTDLTQESNISECYTHLCPFAKRQEQDVNGNYQDVYLSLHDEVIALPTAVTIGHKKALIMDFSDKFSESEEFTESALRSKANTYIEKNNLGVPKVNISVSFVQLWQTEEYKNIAPLERVRLCDTVKVKFSKLGVNATSKVIKTEYNSILEKYEKITLGDAKSSFADTLNKQDEAIQGAYDKIDEEKNFVAERDKALKELSDTMANSMGLFVTRVPQPNGSTTVYYHNAATLESSTYIYTRNAGGFAWTDGGWNNGKPVWKYGVSKDGNAIMNTIVANKLWAELIVAGRLQSKDGQNFFDLDTGDAEFSGIFKARPNNNGLFNTMSVLSGDVVGQEEAKQAGLSFFEKDKTTRLGGVTYFNSPVSSIIEDILKMSILKRNSTDEAAYLQMNRKGGIGLYGNTLSMTYPDESFGRILTTLDFEGNKLLWSGRNTMSGATSIELTEPISAQMSGIVLIFTGIGGDWYYNSHFVSKHLIADKGTVDMHFTSLAATKASAHMSKYLNISNTTISGSSSNKNGEKVTFDGVTFSNNQYALSYVYGV